MCEIKFIACFHQRQPIILDLLVTYFFKCLIVLRASGPKLPARKPREEPPERRLLKKTKRLPKLIMPPISFD